MAYRLLVVAAIASVIDTAADAGDVNVTTYHYDNYRTGWNSSEANLLPGALKGGGGQVFDVTSYTALDDQVDAQPLIMTKQRIKGAGVHDVVYVVTENDTLYALDAETGSILRSRSLGRPVSESSLPGGCDNNASNIGVTGTPVIDAENGVMYLIAYHVEGGGPRYSVHEISLESLDDVIAPVSVTASAPLPGGGTYKFQARKSRQRAALLLASGVVYAGFASFCDLDADTSRGWVLGWKAGTLTPLPHNELTNSLPNSPNDFFLSSVWMSGYGLAASTHGDVYFVTGNSDPGGTTDDGISNLAESVVQMPADLSGVESHFTPSDPGSLDAYDTDFGAGGVMLLPPQSAQATNYAVAAGKDGKMYLLNADALDDSKTATGYLGVFDVGDCWCGPSYFEGSDGIGRVVTSGGYNVGIWAVQAGTTPSLRKLASSSAIDGVQDPGFMTTVSSNGTNENTAVIWAMARADGSQSEHVTLYAFDAKHGQTLAIHTVGVWPNTNNNANLVPVVANGRVYVGTYKNLTILGLVPEGKKVVPPENTAVPPRIPLKAGEHEIWGFVVGINGSSIALQKRDGTIINVDAGKAVENFQVAAPSVGHAVQVRGRFGRPGTMIASVILHAKDHSTAWPFDR